MSGFVLLLFLVVFLAASVYFSMQWYRLRHRLEREAYIRSFSFPLGAIARVHHKYPTLSRQDLESISHGLRHFFLANLKAGPGTIAMPSKIVSDLWHEFLLHEREYLAFVEKAFGRMSHHTKFAKPQNSGHDEASLRRCWQYVCREEGIDPDAPFQLPLLFALDGKLGVANGFLYEFNGGRLQRDAAGNVTQS